MEKQQNIFLGKTIPQVNAPHPTLQALRNASPTKRNRKPGRDELSRCISIWASIYLDDDVTTPAYDPSRMI